MDQSGFFHPCTLFNWAAEVVIQALPVGFEVQSNLVLVGFDIMAPVLLLGEQADLIRRPTAKKKVKLT